MSTTKFGIAAGIVVVALGGAWLALREDAPAKPPISSVEPAAPAPPAPAKTLASEPTPASRGDAAPTRVEAAVDAPIDGKSWRARGQVRAATGAAPIAGARVALALRRSDGTVSELARATSGADGSFAVALPGLERFDAYALTGARLSARFEAEGRQPLDASVALSTAVERGLTIDGRLVEGAAVRGRAVDASSKPLPGATAALSIADGVSGPGGLTLLVEGQADQDGRFALGFAAGAQLLLTVRAEGVGVDAQHIDVEARRDLDVGDVVLAGGPPISGIVLHADGLPAQHLELWAIEGETSFKPDGFEIAVRRAREVESDDTGLSYARTTSDAQGRFVFRGLRPDHYALKAGDPAIVIEPRQGRWEPGQTNVELQLQSPLLVVRVVDAAGAPAIGALVEAMDLGIESDGSYTPGDVRRGIARAPDAALSFSIDPETPVALRARQRGQVSVEKVVYFGQGTQHLEETLALAPRTRDATLRLSVAGTEPSQVALRVALASAATGQRDEDVGVLDADANGVVTNVPSGEHRLHVDFGGTAGTWFFPWRSPTAVKIAESGETAVTIDPVVGARLAITCDLVGPPPAGIDDPAGAASRRERYGARFVLVPKDGGRERTLDLRLGAEDVYLLLPGETAEARDLLPAGDWTIRVEGTRWMATQTPVRLLPGQRLAARVELRGR